MWDRLKLDKLTAGVDLRRLMSFRFLMGSVPSSNDALPKRCALQREIGLYGFGKRFY